MPEDLSREELIALVKAMAATNTTLQTTVEALTATIRHDEFSRHRDAVLSVQAPGSPPGAVDRPRTQHGVAQVRLSNCDTSDEWVLLTLSGR